MKLFCFQLLSFVAIGIGFSAWVCAEIDVKVEVKNFLDRNEDRETTRYLRKTLDLSLPEEELLKQAESRLFAIKAYQSVKCLFSSPLLSCVLVRYPILERIDISGLPLLILEKELLRRLPIRIGDMVTNLSEEDRLSQTRIERTVRVFLESNGFLGSRITRTLQRSGDNNKIVLKIDISDSQFMRVNSVTVVGFSPLPASEIKHDFRTMCMSIEDSLTVLSESTFSCYSHLKLQKTIAYIKKKMDALGYFQANIRARGEVMSAQSNTSTNCALAPSHVSSKGALGISTKCIDVVVNIDAGPQIITEIELENAQSIDLNNTALFFRNILGLELFSRVLDNSLIGAQWPADETIIINQLRQAITFGEGRIVDQKEIDVSVENMKIELAKRGYYSAQISVRTSREKQHNRIRITFAISPGIPVFIRSIQVQSDTNIPSSIVMATADLSAMPRSITSSGHFTKEMLEGDTKQIQKYFNYQGYADAAVKQIITVNFAREAEIHYQVLAGKRKTVGSVVFEGGLEKTSLQALEFLANCQSPKKEDSLEEHEWCRGSPYIPELLPDDVARVTNYYRGRGFLYADAKAHVFEHDGEVDIVFNMYQSQQEVVKKIPIAGILLNGNRLTSGDAMLRHMNLSGSLTNVTPTSLEKGLAKLGHSRLFSRTELNYLGRESMDKFVYADINVVEKPTLTLDSSFSLSTDELFALNLQLNDKNIFGSMLETQTRLNFGLFWGRLSTFKNSVIWPQIFGSDFSLNLMLPLLQYRDQPNRSQVNNKFEAERFFKASLSATVDWALSPEIQPYFKYTIRMDQSQEYNKPFNLFSDPKQTFRTLDGLILVLRETATIRDIFTPGIDYSNVDNPFNPHQGLRMDLFVEFSPQMLGPGEAYAIIGGQIANYLPLGPFTLATQVTARRAIIDDPQKNWWILKYQSDLVPLGGDNSVRGYPNGKIGIYGPDLNKIGKEEKSANGEIIKDIHVGNFSVQGSLELRYFHSSGLGGAIFSDVGYVNICTGFFSCATENSAFEQRSDSRVGLSIGVAVSYLLPVGPISLAYAASPIDKGNGIFDRQERFHFVFGFSF